MLQDDAGLIVAAPVDELAVVFGTASAVSDGDLGMTGSDRGLIEQAARSIVGIERIY
jgi:hypothetical protein